MLSVARRLEAVVGQLQRTVTYGLRDAGAEAAAFFHSADSLVFEYDAGCVRLRGFEIGSSAQQALTFVNRTKSIVGSQMTGDTRGVMLLGDSGSAIEIYMPAAVRNSVRYVLGQSNPRLTEFLGGARYLKVSYADGRLESDVRLEIADSPQDAVAFAQSTTAIDDALSYVTVDGLGAVLVGTSGRTLRIRGKGTAPDWTDGEIQGHYTGGLYRNSREYAWCDPNVNASVAAFFEFAKAVKFVYNKKNHTDVHPAIMVFEDGRYHAALHLESWVPQAHKFFQNNGAINFAQSRVEDGFRAVLVGAVDGSEICIVNNMKMAAVIDSA